MRITINGAQPFQVLATNFSIGPSNEGYTLQISADGRNFSDLFTVPANTTRMVTSVANGSTYRLNGNNSEVVVNWERQCSDGSGGGSGSGGTDPAVVQQMIDASLLDYTQDLIDGEPIVGMAAQLYSPDGVDSNGTFNYRTTAGDADVNSGVAELKQVGGNSIYPELGYDDSASLSRGGEPVTGFSADINWGDTREWVIVAGGSGITGYNSVVAKMEVPSSLGGRQYWHFITSDNLDLEISYVGSWSHNSNVTAITYGEEWSFNGGSIIMNDGWLVATITGGSAVWAQIRADFITLSDDGYQIFIGQNIPNDISAGTHSYTYSDSISAWTPSLPQAITAMTVDGSEYVPQDGDVLTVVRHLVKSGNAVYPTPTKFVSVGLNSFNKEGNTAISQFSEDGGVYTVAVLGVAGLENGYTIFDDNEGITGVGISDSATGTVDTTGAELDARLSYATPTEEKPYLIITTTDIDTLCVHPKWSGYRDEDYEDYMEDEVELASYNSTCPLYSVGSTRNIWNFNGGKLIKNIGTTAYTAEAVDALIEDGKVLGTDFDFDENYIYFVLDTPVETSAPNEQLYEDNDFGVEFFADANGIIPVKAYAATWYMTNLVDKLRRMEGIIHLNSLSETGSENEIYECDDHLWYWKDNGGAVAEWNEGSNSLSELKGYGLIYSHIPNGQTILTFKYRYDSTVREIRMSGDTLVLTDTGGTVISSCTVGNSVQFNAPSNRWIKVKYEKHWIGFELSQYIDCPTVWDGNVTGGHWGIVDHTNYPYIPISYDSGIAQWNSRGQVVHKSQGVDTKTYFINSTGTTDSKGTVVLTTGANTGPNRFYAPEAGGTAGQILLSSGDNVAPVWTNWIKSVKITSDAYEALVQAGTTDPNTLYLIVDE